LNEVATNENLEIQTSFRLLNLIGLIEGSLRGVEKVFSKRFETWDNSTRIRARHGIGKANATPENSERRKRSIDPERVNLRISTDPQFDPESGFKIQYRIVLWVNKDKNQWEISCSCYLVFTLRLPPYSEPWSATIFRENLAVSSLDEAETKITEWRAQCLEHAKTFNAENPLEATACKMIYPQIRELFVNSKWNHVPEDDLFHQQVPEAMYEQFEKEAQAFRNEVHALEKAQSAEENPHE
jgi:hypothetical protein